MEDERLHIQSGERWYCLRTAPKKERIAAHHVRYEGGADVFCPYVRYSKNTRRGQSHFVEALFPGYLFIYTDLQYGLRHILSMHGVTGVVKYGNFIPSMSESLISELRERLGDDECFEYEPDLRVGDEVEIVDGPFKEIIAVIKECPPAIERVKILLTFLGRQIEVDIDHDQIIKREFEPKSVIRR